MKAPLPLFTVPLLLLPQALLDSVSEDGALDDEAGVRAVALFDHEEVGHY